jgi:hypothetical protein
VGAEEDDLFWLEPLGELAREPPDYAQRHVSSPIPTGLPR